MLVAGEAGVGKTVLLRRFCARHAGTARILWGECDGLFTLSPLGPLVDIAEVTGGELADLVADGAPPHAVAAAVLRDLAGRVPAIVVFEDVHWADDATLDVLRLLGRRISAVPALVVASYRDDELDRGHPLRIALGELSRGEATDRLRLVPLSMEAVAELAEPHGVDAAELHRRTAGNPFFVTEALAAGGVELPTTVRDAVLARVAPLSPPARRLLDAAAIVPGTVELPLLEALAGDATSHLEECLSCGVLGATGTAVAFRHDLARVAVEETLAPDRRLALHRRALAALAGADPARLAYHAEGAGDADAVRRFAPTAAERAAAAGAHREAAAQYARALRFGDDLEPAARAALHERRSQECFIVDRPDEAIAELQSALECHRGLGDPRGEGAMLCALSSILWCPGRVEEAYRAGQEAVAILEPLGPGPELAMAYANMASLAMNHESAGETAEWGARALDLARGAQAGEIEIHALNSIGTMQFLTDGPGARVTAERSLELALEAGLVGDTLRAYANLVWAAIRHRAYPLADRYLRAATEYASDPELDLWRIYLLGYRARSELDQGRWDDAADTATLVSRERRASKLPVVLALTVLGRLRARRGDPDPWTPLDEALALAGPELQRIEPVAVARAEAAWLSGDNDRRAGRDRPHRRPRRAARRPLDHRRDRRLAAARRRRRRSRSRRPRAVRARAGRRLRAGRRVLGPRSAARTRPRWRSPAPTTRRRSGGRTTSCAASARRRPPPWSRASCAGAAPPTCRAARGRPRARTRRSSPRASSRCSPSWPTGCATATSPTACSSPPRPSSTTSPRSAPSSARARAARRARRPCASACCR